MWHLPSRARPEGVPGMRREAPRRRPGPTRQGQAERPALRRPRSGAVPARRARRGQAAAEGTARRRALYVMRPARARRWPLALRAVPECAARIRPPALRCPSRRRSLRALCPAHIRGPIPLRPVPRAGEGARFARTQEGRRQEALRNTARERGVCRLQGACPWRRPLSPLRISFQLPRARAPPRVDVAAADHRDRVADLAGAGDLRDGGRGRRLHRLRRAAHRPGGDMRQCSADGALPAMSVPASQEAVTRG